MPSSDHGIKRYKEREEAGEYDDVSVNQRRGSAAGGYEGLQNAGESVDWESVHTKYIC